MSEAYTTVNPLHPDRVLLIFIELAEDSHELGLTDLWNKLDHLIEDDGCLLANLRNLITRRRIVHIHDFLLIRHSHARVHTGDKSNGSHLACRVPIHQSLDHGQHSIFKIFHSYCLEQFLNTFNRL